MSERIEGGDLVMVVGPIQCCRKYTFVQGLVFRVGAFDIIGSWACIHCGSPMTGLPVAQGDGHTIEVARLKRIPPLTEPDSIEKREELTA